MSSSHKELAPLLNENELEGQPLLPTSYFKGRPLAEVESLKNKLNASLKDSNSELTIPQMENILDQNRWLLGFNRFSYESARYTNMTIPFFSGPKSYLGILATASLFAANTSVPYAYELGMGSTVLMTGFYMYAIDPERLALENTLKNVIFLNRAASFCKSLWNNGRQTLANSSLINNPCRTLFDSGKYVLNKLALTSTNSIGSSMSFIAVSPIVASYAPMAWWPVCAYYLYAGNCYYDGFSNDEFWDNLAFLWDKNRPWLVLEFLQQPALAAWALKEGIAAILMRSLTVPSVADESRAAYNFWFTSSELAAAYSVHVFFHQFYVSSYDHAMKQKTDTLRKFAVEAEPDSLPPLQKWKALETEVLADKNYGYAMNGNPGILAQCALSAGIGWYCGSGFDIYGSLAGAAFMFSWAYMANEQRLRQGLIVQLDRAKTTGNSMSSQGQLCFDVSAAGVAAGALAVGCGVSNGTSSITMAKSTVGNSEVAMKGYVLMTLDVVYNNGLFGFDKIKETFNKMRSSVRASSVRATMYGSANILDEEREERSSFFNCFGRRR